MPQIIKNQNHKLKEIILKNDPESWKSLPELLPKAFANILSTHYAYSQAQENQIKNKRI